MSLKKKLLQVSLQLAAGLSVRGGRRPSKPADFLIVTAYTADIATYGTISSQNKRRYALRHGYAFREITSGFDLTRPPAWSKIRFIRDALQDHRFVFWSDADSLVMNESIRLESLVTPDADVVLTRAFAPFPHINTGQMLFRASALSRLFLDATWRLEAFTNDSTWEQRAVNYLAENYQLPRVRVLPNRAFNSLGEVANDPDPFQDGDFVIHFPGLPNKVKLLEKYAAAAR